MTRHALVAVLVVACAPPRRMAAPREPTPPRTDDTFALLGDAAAQQAIEFPAPDPRRGDPKAPPPHYVVQREPSGVTSELRAVSIGGGLVVAAGDDGVVLRRDATTGWQREATPTTQRIRALLGWLAVGDGGLVMTRSAAGVWTIEPTGVTADLYAVSAWHGRLIAVGDHGTILERVGDEHAWHVVASHSDADLRAFDSGIASGVGGALVDCAFWDREQRDAAKLIACVPVPSPTHADLLASTDEPWHAYGADGTRVARTPGAPFEPVAAALEPALEPSHPTITAAALNHWLTSETRMPVVLVGRGGAIALVGELRTTAVTQLTLPDPVDLDAVASARLDAFAVGAHGTIVHLQSVGVTIPKLYPL